MNGQDSLDYWGSQECNRLVLLTKFIKVRISKQNRKSLLFFLKQVNQSNRKNNIFFTDLLSDFCFKKGRQKNSSLISNF